MHFLRRKYQGQLNQMLLGGHGLSVSEDDCPATRLDGRRPDF